MSDRHEDPGIHLRSVPDGTFASSEGLRRENQALREALLELRWEGGHHFSDETCWCCDCLPRDPDRKTEGGHSEPCLRARAALRGTTP